MTLSPARGRGDHPDRAELPPRLPSWFRRRRQCLARGQPSHARPTRQLPPQAAACRRPPRHPQRWSDSSPLNRRACPASSPAPRQLPPPHGCVLGAATATAAAGPRDRPHSRRERRYGRREGAMRDSPGTSPSRPTLRPRILCRQGPPGLPSADAPPGQRGGPELRQSRTELGQEPLARGARPTRSGSAHPPSSDPCQVHRRRTVGTPAAAVPRDAPEPHERRAPTTHARRWQAGPLAAATHRSGRHLHGCTRA